MIYLLCYNLNLSGHIIDMDGFPSGQRGQTVNLLATPSKVRILLHPLVRIHYILQLFAIVCRRGGTGRRTGLKILRD